MAIHKPLESQEAGLGANSRHISANIPMHLGCQCIDVGERECVAHVL